MKTAISIPDPLFQRGEALARRLSMSRSQLFRAALEEFLARHDEDTVTTAIDRALVQAGDLREEDAAWLQASQGVLRGSEWDG